MTHFKKGRTMTFEIGEKVRLKHVTDDDKNNSALTYWDKFKNYEGLTATSEVTLTILI